MRICFCDDEKSFHTVVENMIQKWSKEKGVLCEIFHYDSAEQMLFENEQNFSFDLILLDIQMGKMDGVEPVSYTHLDVYKRQGRYSCRRRMVR